MGKLDQVWHCPTSTRRIWDDELTSGIQTSPTSQPLPLPDLPQQCSSLPDSLPTSPESGTLPSPTPSRPPTSLVTESGNRKGLPNPSRQSPEVRRTGIPPDLSKVREWGGSQEVKWESQLPPRRPEVREECSRGGKEGGKEEGNQDSH